MDPQIISETREVNEVDLSAAITQDEFNHEAPKTPDDVEEPPEVPEIPEQVTTTPEIPDIPSITDEVVETPEVPDIPEQINNCESEGVIPTITGVMGTLQANEVVNSILKFNSNMEKKMIVFNSIKMSFRTIRLSRNKNCSNKG